MPGGGKGLRREIRFHDAGKDERACGDERDPGSESPGGSLP